MLIPELTALTDVALLLLRVVVALVFASSGWSHLTQPNERAKSIEMSPAFTFLLGAGELAGAVSLILGIFAQAGAALLIAIMLGALYKKIFVWKSGFWGKETGSGWYYELLYVAALFVVLATAGGAIRIV